MKITEQLIRWLNLLLTERLGRGLIVESAYHKEYGEQLVISHLAQALEVYETDFDSLIGLNIRTLDEALKLIARRMSCFEELNSTLKDAHDRYPASSSQSYIDKTIGRPVVDECFEVIRGAVTRQWPRFELIEHSPSTLVTCDVDNPYEFYLLSQRAFIKKLGGDLLKRKSLNEFHRTWRNYWQSTKQDYSVDPNNNFDWMMDVYQR